MRKIAPDVLEARRYLASLIDTALNAGVRGDWPHERTSGPWTNQDFANGVGAVEGAVRSWRNQNNPVRPTNIVPLLRVFFGDNDKFSAPRKAMLEAWRRAGGFVVNEPPPALRPIETRSFSDHAAIVALLVDRPEAPNDNLVIPFSLRIHPDPRCRIAGHTVELGVTEAFFEVESEHWQPSQDSILWTRDHPNIEPDGTRTGVKLIGPPGNKEQINGEPLAGVATIALRPKEPGADGPVTLSVRVFDDGFKVTPRDGSNVSETQKTVIEAIFGGAFRKDVRGRLIVASETVHPPNSKLSG